MELSGGVTGRGGAAGVPNPRALQETVKNSLTKTDDFTIVDNELSVNSSVNQ
jgi:hypothetical protein